MKTFDITNSVAFVTGTNKKNGIGRAIVKALIDNGAAKVYATARRAAELKDLVEEYEGKVVAVELDVTDLEAIKALASKYPDVTLLVNNAGLAILGPLSEQDPAAAVKQMQVNYLAPFAIIQNFTPLFMQSSSQGEQKATAIVNINSINSLITFRGTETYSASKAAAHSMTQSQRRELPNTLVIGVYPGPIDTALSASVPLAKASTSVVADAMVEALKTGTEDVFPDEMAKNLYEGWKADAKAIEKQFAE